jgi:BMFP domain-containing protein YqiC
MIMGKFKYITVLIVLALAVSLSACKKFLDEELKGQRADVQFFETAEDAELYLTGIYNVLSFADADNRIWVFGDIASDDAAKGGIPGDQADIGRVDDFDLTTDNGNLETVWKIYYEGVSRANKLLDNIEKINMDAGRKSEITGEAKFLRAYYYYWLSSIFGDIPVHTTTPTPEEMQKPATPVEDIRANVIIPDLQDAANRLPETFTGPDLGRPTKYAALALLGKMYLFQEQWQEAEDAFQQIVGSGLFDLVLLYRENFEATTRNNVETIFAVQHLEGQNPWLGNRLNQWFAPRSENGYGFNVPTQNFVDEFEMTQDSVYDPRLDYTVGREGHTWFSDTAMFDPEWSPTGYMQKKY